MIETEYNKKWRVSALRQRVLAIVWFRMRLRERCEIGFRKQDRTKSYVDICLYVIVDYPIQRCWQSSVAWEARSRRRYDISLSLKLYIDSHY